MSLITSLQFLQVLALQLLERLSALGRWLYQNLVVVKEKVKKSVKKSATQKGVGSKTEKEKADNLGKSHIGDARGGNTTINVHEEGNGDVFITQKTGSPISYSKAEKQDSSRKGGKLK